MNLRFQSFQKQQAIISNVVNSSSDQLENATGILPGYNY
jgi:hypothetical protein